MNRSVPLATDAVSAFAPLRVPVYRALWIATLASNMGTWMQDVGAAWLMTTLSASPVMVALVRAANATPMFLLALPAGALADIVDRRRLLLVTQFWMLASAAALAALTFFDFTTPSLLLLLTASLAIGTAFNAPAWQAIVPELVPRAQLVAAISLNSAAINLARSVGPAIGGLLIASTGPEATFALNAVSFFGTILVIHRWQRPAQEAVLPAERLVGAVRAGLRYVRHAPLVLALLARQVAFTLSAAALLALLPALARFEYGRGPTGYGVLLGFFGAGAVLAAALLPRVRARLSPQQLVAAATLLFALALAMLALVRAPIAVDVAVLLAGAAWLSILSTFNSSIQAVVPSWVRGRALSVSILTFFGGMALGSVLWGYVASHFGFPTAFGAAALGLCVGLAATYRRRLASGEPIDLSPSVHWPAPAVAEPIADDRGPVVVTVEYRIDVAKRRHFRRIMRRVRRIRRRDGAFNWALLSDVAEPRRHTEIFVVESWLEHLRQHERVTVADRIVLDRAKAFHVGESPPRVTHYLVDTNH